MRMQRDEASDGRRRSCASVDVGRLGKMISAKEVLELLGAVVMLVVSGGRREGVDVEDGG